jgi:carboxylesterase type B
MVWIHGGGWREFAGTAPGFDGTNLARAQDVVVVTVNLRLSAFGYLWHAAMAPGVGVDTLAEGGASNRDIGR